MRLTIAIVVCIALFCATVLIASSRAPIVSAAPHAQSTVAPTEEPTKPPYVFPTPVFVPTYPDDTPIPRATSGATRAPGQPAAQTYTIQLGDSPWTIAQEVYGDGSKYPLIMSANNITSSTRLRVGTVLTIPPLSGAAPTLNPTAVPVVPTLAPPTLAPTTAPTGATPTPLPTPAGTSLISGSLRENLVVGINLLSGFLLVGALFTGILAYVSFARKQRLGQILSGTRSFRVRN